MSVKVSTYKRDILQLNPRIGYFKISYKFVYYIVSCETFFYYVTFAGSLAWIKQM